MTYVGIGLNHPLEVEGQIFISNTETTNVPFEIYSNYSEKGSLIDSRQLRLRVIPSEIPASTSHIDMGIDNTTGNSFYISQPVYDSSVTGNKDTFKIDNQGTVSLNVKNYNADDIYGNLVSSSNMIIDESNILTSNLTISTGVSFDFNYSNVVTSTPLSIEKVYTQLYNLDGTNMVSSVMLITTEGSVYSCGYNPYGQLATGTNLTTKFFTKAVGDGASGVVKLARNESRTIALKNNGKVYSSGRGIVGLLSSIVFKEITSINNVVDIAITNSAAFFVKSDGSAYAIGSNSDGSMGIGNQPAAYTPTLLINGASDVSAIAASPRSTAILKNNAVYTSGYNDNGSLGISSVPIGTSITTHQLTDGEGTSGVDQVEFNGTSFSYAALHIRKGGAIYSTGDNYWGQLGIGTSGSGSFRTTFTAAIEEGASNVTELLLNGRIIKTDNKIYYSGSQAYNTNKFTQLDFDGPVSDWSNYSINFFRTETLVSESNIFVRYISPFYGTPLSATTFSEVPGSVPSDVTIAEINNINYGSPVIKFNSTRYQDDYGAYFGLHETASSNVLRMGVISAPSSTNYVTVNEYGTVSASSFQSFKGMHDGISSNVIEKDLIVSVDPTSSPIISSVNNILTSVKLSDIENDPNVFGVSNGDGYYNAVGNGTVWVTDENGTFTSGDYITSSTLSGYGVKQDDDTQMNYTVAKILQNCDFTKATRFIIKLKDKTLTTTKKPAMMFNPKNIFRAEVVACTYHCG
jgi:hypothetical protein